jgi:urease accessory protein
VAHNGVRSVVTHAFATSPLRILTPANHGRAAWIYTSSYGGGLVDGDRLRIDLDVDEGAAAFLSTQAATKVYRSPRGTEVELNARVASNSMLIAAPDPVVCFAAARYHQMQRFDVAAGGALVVADCLIAGRCAAGERWAFTEYRSLLQVSVNGRLLVYDATSLRAMDGDLGRRFGRFEAMAVAVVVGGSFAEHARELVAVWSSRPTVRRAGQLGSALPLGDAGCILRLAGNSAEQVVRALRESLDFVPARLGDDPWRRKW